MSKRPPVHEFSLHSNVTRHIFLSMEFQIQIDEFDNFFILSYDINENQFSNSPENYYHLFNLFMDELFSKKNLLLSKLDLDSQKLIHIRMSIHTFFSFIEQRYIAWMTDSPNWNESIDLLSKPENPILHCILQFNSFPPDSIKSQIFAPGDPSYKYSSILANGAAALFLLFYAWNISSDRGKILTILSEKNRLSNLINTYNIDLQKFDIISNQMEKYLGPNTGTFFKYR